MLGLQGITLAFSKISKETFRNPLKTETKQNSGRAGGHRDGMLALLEVTWHWWFFFVA